MTRTTPNDIYSTTLFLAFELSKETWVLAVTDRNGRDVRVGRIRAGDWADFERFVAKMKKRLGLPENAEVRTCYEAGRDGFWLAHALAERGIVNLVLDPSSIEVPRKKRRAKTDRIDAKKLLALLLRLAGGEDAAQIVRVPTLEIEDERQPQRERQSLQEKLTSTTNQITSLLTTQGVTQIDARRFPGERVSDLRNWKGESLPPKLVARLKRAFALRDAFLKLLKELETEISADLRDRALASEHDAQDDAAVRLQQLVSIGETIATVFARELMWRDFKNRRQVGAYTGLVSVPNLSGDGGQNGSISKSGNPRVRRMGIEAAWLWVRHQPESELTKWFLERFGRGKRNRRVGIVALARRLIIALWRFVKDGVVPDGARLKAA